RKVLNAGAGGSNCIETVAKAGYRLTLPVHLVGSAELPANDVEPTVLQMLKTEARANLHKVERLPALKALVLFERALRRSPTSAECHAGMASTYVQMASTTIRRPLQVVEAMQLAQAAAQRALAVDENNGEARAVLG